MEDSKFKFEKGRFIRRATGEPIPDDEPVMLFRARDRHALDAINHYFSVLTDPEHKAAVASELLAFEKFQADHPERMREPKAP